jgi:hypothetical protein
MKKVLNKTTKTVGILAIVAIFFTSCAESHYYHRNHHHTRDWYDHHHQPRPAGVNFEVDVIR